ncbi:uncharacterized protein LOC122883156 [Siniperca chuatsi]|uniref:uncharacterized protein LOC122883156 n=1 Tax=Siniperca chuatsi TaxID=119488 RepID=UPI001CE07E20|nr:uncharacterized protein LOC122883156 [Siniperca chuatsi]
MVAMNTETNMQVTSLDESHESHVMQLQSHPPIPLALLQHLERLHGKDSDPLSPHDLTPERVGCLPPASQTVRHVSGLYSICFVGAEDCKPTSWRCLEGCSAGECKCSVSHPIPA